MSKKRLVPWLLVCMFVTLLVMGAGEEGLKEYAGMSLLSSTSVIIGDDSDSSKIDLYTIPAGKNGIVEYIILREPSGTLAGCADLNFGVGAGTTGSWIDGETGVAEMTAVTDYYVLERTNHISNEFTVIDGGDATANNRTFGVYVVTGATTDAATVTIDVFGYLF